MARGTEHGPSRPCGPRGEWHLTMCNSSAFGKGVAFRTTASSNPNVDEAAATPRQRSTRMFQKVRGCRCAILVVLRALSHTDCHTVNLPNHDSDMRRGVME